MKYVVLDLESTCWKERTPIEQTEIIEIGAVALDDSFTEQAVFDRFIKPIEKPVLSDFCTQLTKIRQADVDAAMHFAEVFTEFLKWLADEPYTIMSWGEYDIRQLEIECKRHHLKLPSRFKKKHVNVKQLFAERRRCRPCGMAQALEMMRMPLRGTHHRAIDDVRNIAAITRVLLA